MAELEVLQAKCHAVALNRNGIYAKTSQLRNDSL